MFEGFTPETVDFLWGIRMNNRRDWFLEHKEDYVNTLYQPMKELGKELFSLVENSPGNLLKVSRIYRDARLHYPVPYKESLWICIRKDVQWWAEHPCLYFEIRPEGISYGFCLWRPKTQMLEQMRKQWAERPQELIQLLKKTEKATGVPVTADLYKRPKPAPIPELEPYYAWRGNISCVKEEPFSEAVFGPDLARRVKAFLEALVPLYEYFNRLYD